MQSGGSFDVDYSVTAPGDKVVLDGTKERQGDFVFTAQTPGEYTFCFNNEMSTFAEKMVDFEIAVCSCSRFQRERCFLLVSKKRECKEVFFVSFV